MPMGDPQSAERETRPWVSRDLQVKLGEQQDKSCDRFAWSKTGRVEDDPHRERRGDGVSKLVEAGTSRAAADRW